LKEKQKLT